MKREPATIHMETEKLRTIKRYMDKKSYGTKAEKPSLFCKIHADYGEKQKKTSIIIAKTNKIYKQFV